MLYGIGGQRFNPKNILSTFKNKSIAAFLIIDETQIQTGSSTEEAWLWVAIKPLHRRILGVYISRHRNILVTEAFLRSRSIVIW